MSLPGWIPARLLTVQEVAELLQLSSRQVRRLIAEKRLEALHLGSSVRVRPEAVAALLQSK
jgi:excisionase family DNA binding protein